MRKHATALGLLLNLCYCMGCTPTHYEPTTSDTDRVVGCYHATIAANREADLEISPDMSYHYREDSTRNGRVHEVIRSGTLRFREPRVAKLGLVRLSWRARGTVEVWSPYGTTLGGSSGTVGVSRHQVPVDSGHKFMLTKVSCTTT